MMLVTLQSGIIETQTKVTLQSWIIEAQAKVTLKSGINEVVANNVRICLESHLR